ncbi:MAG TPA: glycosyltransferase family 4 protein [Bryobacteraceae bacterium]|nr:glycosyltransferase family 4 protein [Bryobacteraceae bacterium]
MPTLVVFDSSITNNSPAGSCLLKLLRSLAGKWPIHTFVNRTDLADAPLLAQTRIPLPDKPVFVRTILFTLFATCAYALHRPDSPKIRIATEGAFAFCQISHTQFCHRYFLRYHRGAIASTWLRRLARTINHGWCCLLEPIAFRYAAKIVVPSHGMARELELTYPVLTRGKVHVIPNPIDVEDFVHDPSFDSTQIYQHLGIGRGAFVLAFCALGGFTRKGLEVVLRALANIDHRVIHLIVIGGETNEIREFAALTKQLGLASNAHFVGLQHDIRPYLWSAHAFVFPSAYETFSLASFQAAAAGLPLIATRLNGVEDFLVDGLNGWLVERSVESVAAAIRDAATSPEKTAMMGQTAREQVQAYRTELFQKRWLQLLESEFGIRPVAA